MKWRSLTGTHYEGNIEEILEEAIQREFNLGHQLKICVGTDSQVYKDKIEYATVVVVLREGRGGFMFIKSDKGHGPISIKERMLIEVSKSIEVAYAICPILEKYSIGLEVHADINTDPQFFCDFMKRSISAFLSPTWANQIQALHSVWISGG